jgi:hypothetical protein
MSSRSRESGKAAAERGHRSKRIDRRAARRRAAIEAKLASADQLIEKRRAQLSSASVRRTAIAAKLARMLVPADQTSPSMAYCIKDRRQVEIGGAHAVVLANGRPAIAGLCLSCGSKVMRLGAG